MQPSELEALHEPFAHFAWLALLHSLWIGMAAASCAALLLQLGIRLSRRARHSIALTALAVAAVGPILVAPIHDAIARRPAQAAAHAIAPIPADLVAPPLAAEVQLPSRQARSKSTKPLTTSARLAVLTASTTSLVGEALRHCQPIGTRCWLAGTCAMATVLVLGAYSAWRTCRTSSPVPPAIQTRATELARRLGLKAVPRVLAHAGLSEPFLCGMVRPSILLPPSLLRGSRPELLDAVLAHELAHARRHDHLVNLVERLVEAVLFFHPAVHWISRSIRREREYCADAMAVRATGDRLALAGALESIARLRLLGPSSHVFMASFGGESPSLLPRIQELIGMTPSRPRRRLWPFAAIPAAAILAFMTGAAGVAQDGQPGVYVAPTAQRPQPPPDCERQVSMEVRWVSLDAEPWRNSMIDRLKLVQEEGDVSVWTIDEHTIFDLLTSAQGDTNANVLQAPKVTVFENAHAQLFSTTKEWYTVRVDKVAVGGSIGFRPTTKEFEVGIHLGVAGSRLRDGTRLSVDLRDTSFASLHTLTRKVRVGDHDVAAQYQIPTVIERQCKATCDVPEKSALLISLGLHDRRGRLSDPGEAASEVLKRVGLPPVPARPVASERLVMITPRWIVP
jgi:beta-lactamase regulating signal transducer with metallopeptidase domain